MSLLGFEPVALATSAALARWIAYASVPSAPLQHQVSTGTGWISLTQHRAPALPTAPFTRTGVPFKHATGLHSSPKDDDEPPQLVSSGFKGGGTIAAMCIERTLQSAGLGRGQAASYRAPCINQAAEINTRRLKEQRKAETGGPPVHILPIPELDQQRLISSKVSSICLSLYLIQLTLWPTAVSWNPSPHCRQHPKHRLVHLLISVLASYTTQLILHAVSC
jgi:hypothetical protein